MTEADPLASVELYRLFDDRSVSVQIEPDAPTVITGSNGSGKTTLLRAIDALATARWQSLYRLPIDGVVVTFGSGRSIQARRRPGALSVEDSRGTSFTVPIQEYNLERLLQTAQRHGLDAWAADEGRVELDGAIVGVEVLAEQLQELGLAPADAERGRSGDRQRPLFRTRLLSTDRVTTAPYARSRSFPGRRMPVSVRTVDRLPADVQRLMAQAQQAYARRSQDLDRTLPRRIVAAMRHEATPIDRETTRASLERVRSSRSKLMDLGLLAAADEPVDSSWIDDEGSLPVVGLILEDTARKYAELEPLERDLTAFRDFVHDRLRQKKLVFSGDTGFEVVVHRNDHDLATVKPSSLSSGEQQLIILAHAVSLEIPHGTVVLVDEPELSLHPQWQEDLIDDLERLAIERGVQFVLATHSPTISGSRPELRRSLDQAERGVDEP